MNGLFSKLNSTYIPAFDGLRGISILIVFIAHLGYEHIIPGGLGVTIFFFISGFLITRLLIQEYEKSQTIGMKNFFIRRLLRLYPPLLFLVLVLSVLLLIIEFRINLVELAAAIFYFENYYVVFSNALPKRFQILWSLAIEEHFYLIFPFLFLLFYSRKAILFIVVGLLLLFSLAFRIYIATQYHADAYSDLYTYSLTHCRADSIMYGCLLSLILHVDKRQHFLRMTSSLPILLTGFGLLLFSLLYRDDFFRQTFRYSVQGLAFLIILPAILYNDRYEFFNRLLSIKPLIFIGKLSYSIYLFHWAALYVGLQYFTKGDIGWFTSVITITALLALTSYYLVEKKMAALRRKYGSHVK